MRTRVLVLSAAPSCFRGRQSAGTPRRAARQGRGHGVDLPGRRGDPSMPATGAPASFNRKTRRICRRAAGGPAGAATVAPGRSNSRCPAGASVRTLLDATPIRSEYWPGRHGLNRGQRQLYGPVYQPRPMGLRQALAPAQSHTRRSPALLNRYLHRRAARRVCCLAGRAQALGVLPQPAGAVAPAVVP